MKIGKPKKQVSMQQLSEEELKEQQEFEELKKQVKEYAKCEKKRKDAYKLPFTVCGL